MKSPNDFEIMNLFLKIAIFRKFITARTLLA